MSDYPIKSPRKLIEVALPLDAINKACAREKSIRHGHPSTLHLWWARRPLAAARAVIFSQLVNDPSWKWELEHSGKIPPGQLKASWAASRKRLFKIIEDLVLWENTTNEVVLERARVEIRRSWREVCELNKDHPQAAELFNPDKLPALHDPFAGGGAIPLEAQRLGLEAHASDLNPVAVLINKAMIEIPPKFAGRPPVSLAAKERKEHKDLDSDSMRSLRSFAANQKSWPGATGLAEDVRYYGAWIWARTVKSPNPAFSHVDVPLASTFVLSSKAGKEAYVQPVIEGDRYRFTVRMGTPPPEAEKGTKLARGAKFKCILSNIPMEGDYIKSEGCAGHMGATMMAIVAEGIRGRIYLAPTAEMEAIARSAKPKWKPETLMPINPRWFSPPDYGMPSWSDLFTPRQLVALTTFSDLIAEVRERILRDAEKAEFSHEATKNTKEEKPSSRNLRDFVTS
jgi:putative DNA methylase